MRNTDDPNPRPIRPLGEKVTPKTPAPPAPKPVGPMGIVTGPDGKMRTTKNPY